LDTPRDAHIPEVLPAVNERQDHPCQQQLELLEAVVTPCLELGGHIVGARGVHSRFGQN
jgi:hypothetical protein